jgi:hypothetical protein
MANAALFLLGGALPHVPGRVEDNHSLSLKL